MAESYNSAYTGPQIDEAVGKSLALSPATKTAAMTQPVGQDGEGKLWTAPGSVGMTTDIKDALLLIASHVAYTDDQGQAYYSDLLAALYPVASIDAAFAQGSSLIFDTDSLDVLRQYLTVTATYEDGTTGVVTGYTLSGTLAEGLSTITASFAGSSDTFTVDVVKEIPSIYQQVDSLTSDGNSYIDTGFIVTNTPIVIEVDFEKAMLDYDQPILGTRKTTTDYCLCASNNHETNYGFGISTHNRTWDWSRNRGNANTRYNLKIEYQDGSQKLYLNGTQIVSSAVSGIDFTDFENLPIYYYAYNLGWRAIVADECAKMTSSYLRISAPDGTKYRDMVPVYRKSDNVAGFFDKIARQFHPNIGTGSFIIGGDIA